MTPTYRGPTTPLTRAQLQEQLMALRRQEEAQWGAVLTGPEQQKGKAS